LQEIKMVELQNLPESSRHGEALPVHTDALYLAAYDPPSGVNYSAGKFHLDQIHASKDRIDALLHSAYLESNNGTPSGPMHAIEDHKDAIRAADSINFPWLKTEEQGIFQSLSYGRDRQSTLATQFEQQVEGLPSGLRQKVNNLRFILGRDYSEHGAEAWNTHAGEVGQIMALLPPKMRKTFGQMRQTDEQLETALKALVEAQDLESYPEKTRLLAARQMAKQGNIDGSRDMINEMMRLKPDLAQSPLLAQIFENPHLLSTNVEWDGVMRRSKPPERRKSGLEQLLEELGPKTAPSAGDGRAVLARPERSI
jgi:hypothetical protein